jgi:hypothetical protein
MATFVSHTQRLARARAASRPGSCTPHTVVVLPSYSVADSLLRHYADRLLELEHRHLLHLLMLARVPAAQMVFVTSARPSRQVVDYYLSLLPPERRRDVRARLRFLEVPDPQLRSVSAKLLDRPDLLARLREMVDGRIGYVDPWNVTPTESRVARLIGLPLNGTPSRLWPVGFKSSGRRIMRSAGVPLPEGFEDVRSVDDIVAAVEAVRRRRPDAAGVVVKTDNSGAGDGNRVLPLAGLTTPAAVRGAVMSLEPWYLDDVTRGAVVEEFLVAPEMTFPSVQLDIAPGGQVEVVSTHEQVVGGPTGQVYLGCRFPAEPAYAAELSRHGAAVGHVLAERGALGRLSVDFAATRDSDLRWQLRGLEINLRKTGTTHPFAALSNLVPGRYDTAAGVWTADDGTERCYRSTDNLADPALRGRSAREVVTTLRSAGLELDRRTGTGVVLHMFCGLGAGRLGLTAVGRSTTDADVLYEAAVGALSVRAAGVALPV